jgi:DNA-binding beta-propeller fold protein YncE
MAMTARAGVVTVSPPPTALATLNVSVLDATTGRVVRTVELGQNGDAYLVGLAVDAPHNRVFVGSFFGLTMLDATSGRVLATLDAGMPTALAADDDTGWVYATYVNSTNQYGIPTSNGSVAIFDPATAERLTTVTVGLGPDTVAIDHTSGDALILDQSGMSMLALSAGAPMLRREPEPADPAAASPGARYFPATHHNLVDPLRAFWLRYGSVDDGAP